MVVGVAVTTAVLTGTDDGDVARMGGPAPPEYVDVAGLVLGGRATGPRAVQRRGAFAGDMAADRTAAATLTYLAGDGRNLQVLTRQGGRIADTDGTLGVSLCSDAAGRIHDAGDRKGLAAASVEVPDPLLRDSLQSQLQWVTEVLTSCVVLEHPDVTADQTGEVTARMEESFRTLVDVNDVLRRRLEALEGQAR